MTKRLTLIDTRMVLAPIDVKKALRLNLVQNLCLKQMNMIAAKKHIGH